MTRSKFRISPRVNWFILNQARKRRHSTPQIPRVPQYLKDLVQGYWTMDETTGTRFDSSGHLIHLTQYRGAVGNQAGKVGLAGQFFDDVNANFLGNQDPGVSQGYLIADAADVSLNVWIKREANQDMFICGRYNQLNGPQAYDYFLKINDSGDLHFQIKTGNGTDPGNHDDIVTCSGPALSQWHMVTVVVDLNGAGNIRIYVDSVLQNSVGLSDNTVAGFPGGQSVDFTVGCSGTASDPGLPFRGGIDELGNWCYYAMTQADINALWNGGLGCTW